MRVRVSGGLAVLWVLALCLIAIILYGLWASHQESNDAPRPPQSGALTVDPSLQSGRADLGSATALDGIAGCFIPGVPLAVECLEHAPHCPFEDGDPSGWPCLWVDPDGGIYYVDSREYRR